MYKSVDIGTVPSTQAALPCCTAMLSRCIRKDFDRGSPVAVAMRCPTSAKNAAASSPIGPSVSIHIGTK